MAEKALKPCNFNEGQKLQYASDAAAGYLVLRVSGGREF
jgi:hypothetical protein